MALVYTTPLTPTISTIERTPKFALSVGKKNSFSLSLPLCLFHNFSAYNFTLYKEGSNLVTSLPACWLSGGAKNHTL